MTIIWFDVGLLILYAALIQLPAVNKQWSSRRRWGLTLFFLLVAIFMTEVRRIPYELLIWPLLLIIAVGLAAIWPTKNFMSQLRRGLRTPKAR